MADKTVTITSPVKNYNGISAGVRFTDGKAEITVPRQQAALEYFARHRFGISGDVPAPKGEDDLLAVGATGDPGAPEKQPKGEGRRKSAAAKASTTTTPGQPAKGAGDGPLGPQHNTGQDGANPGAPNPQTTPTDAGI